MQSDSGQPDPNEHTPESHEDPAPRPISELLTDPGFPKSALGQFVDIGGYTGVVTDVVNLSLRVKSPDGITKSFNANGLRRIYGPPVRPEPIPIPSTEPPPRPHSRETLRSRSVAPLEAPLERKAPMIEPDFSKPIKKITDLVRRPGFPQSALGEHVEIAGYTGVVVQIVNRSLKVRSQTETTRSYNGDALKKLYG